MTQTYWEGAHRTLSTLFNSPGAGIAGYAGYKPEVREAPAGGAAVDTGKRYLHVARKYDPPSWAVDYLARAHWEACIIAERISVPAEYMPRTEDGTLRVLEYPDAKHAWKSPRAGVWAATVCELCGTPYDHGMQDDLCPARAAGAGTAEHTDPSLFTVNLWRSTPEDHEHRRDATDKILGHRLAGFPDVPSCVDCGETLPDSGSSCWVRGTNGAYHIGEIGALVGLGRAVPHRVPARAYTQRALVYFAIPSHAARVPRRTDAGVMRETVTVGDFLAEWKTRSRVPAYTSGSR